MFRDLMTISVVATIVCGSVCVSPALSGGTSMVAVSHMPINGAEEKIGSDHASAKLVADPILSQAFDPNDVCESVVILPTETRLFDRSTVMDTNEVDARGEAVVARMANTPPVYPRIARERGYEGDVIVSVTVRADGTCGDVTVKRSSGHTVLDAAAVKAIRCWRFDLSWCGFEARDTRIEFPVEFKLENKRVTP